MIGELRVMNNEESPKKEIITNDISVQAWGVTTRKGSRLFVHIFNHDTKELFLPLQSRVKDAFVYDTKQRLKTK